MSSRVLVRQGQHGWRKGEASEWEAPSAANQPAADLCPARSRQAQGSGQVTEARALRRRVRAATSRARAGEFAHSVILLLMLAEPVTSGQHAVNVRIMLDQQVVPDVLRQWWAILTHSSHGSCLFQSWQRHWLLGGCMISESSSSVDAAAAAASEEGARQA